MRCEFQFTLPNQVVDIQMKLCTVPELLPGCASPEAFQRVYAQHQVVLLKQYRYGKPAADDASNFGFGLEQLANLHAQYPQAVAKTWGVENGPASLRPSHLTANLAPICSGDGGGGGDESGTSSTSAVATSATSLVVGDRWYASFLVQKDAAFHQLLHELPVSEPPALTALKAHHTPCIWVFVCKNVGSKIVGDDGTFAPAEPFRGRVEHIDAVQHSGTWHLQVSGTKRWRIRPNIGGDWAAARGFCTTCLLYTSPSPRDRG